GIAARAETPPPQCRRAPDNPAARDPKWFASCSLWLEHRARSHRRSKLSIGVRASIAMPPPVGNRCSPPPQEQLLHREAALLSPSFSVVHAESRTNLRED